PRPGRPPGARRAARPGAAVTGTSAQDRDPADTEYGDFFETQPLDVGKHASRAEVSVAPAEPRPGFARRVRLLALLAGGLVLAVVGGAILGVLAAAPAAPA